jgi:DNA-binding LytR/AlgR family response regulator
MIKAVAIDDELPALKVIENFCNKTEGIELQKSFNMPTEALKYINKFPVDLLFLDINMPSLTGIELFKSVKQNTMVIFTTAYSEYAVEGFNLNAVDYLLKPFTFRRFQQAVQKANDYFEFQHRKQKTQPGYIFIRADYLLMKINLDDILFIEGLDDYLKIHLIGQKPVTARMTMKNILEKLPPENFIRIHRSYIIPFKKINSIKSKMVFIGEAALPIGSSYEDSFLKHFNK